MQIIAPNPFAPPAVSYLPRTATPPAGQATPASDISTIVHIDPRLDPELAEQARAAVRLLPPDDIELLHDANVPILVYATPLLRGTEFGHTEIELGETGTWRPNNVSVAGELQDALPMGFTLAHEVGHAVSVLRRQDRSEGAADAYAMAHFPLSPEQAAVAVAQAAERAKATTPPTSPAPAPDVPPDAQAPGTDPVPPPTGADPVPDPGADPEAEPEHDRAGWVAGGVLAALLGIALLAL